MGCACPLPSRDVAATSAQNMLVHKGFHRRSHQLGVVAHREVIATPDRELLCSWKQRLPLGLETQRVVALTEDGQQRPIRQGAAR